MSEILPSNCKINVIVKLYLTHALVCFKFFWGILNNIVKNTIQTTLDIEKILEVFYLNTIEQLFLFVEKLDQLEVCLPYIRLLTGIPILAVFQNLRWNSNKTSLCANSLVAINYLC